MILIPGLVVLYGAWKTSRRPKVEFISGVK
jgi:hypothetical protein